MKNYILGALLLASQISVFAQKKDKVLFKINETPTYVSEFNKLFKTDRASLNSNTFDEDLQLMIDYKLKLSEASYERIDTLPSLKSEFEGYKKNIVSSYIADDRTLDVLLREAYDRTVNQVTASHLLIATEANDTLKAYNKILSIKKQLADGASFEEMAIKHSDDRSVTKNKGELGSFNAFQMVYPFETAAFNTPVGAVSNIVKTRFGYHLIKVKAKEKTGAKINTAHLMIAGAEDAKKAKIDTIYNELIKGGNFSDLVKKYSQDKGSARKGGVLKPFSRGVLPKPFEDAAFALTVPKSYSKPFKTQYGWHIVQFIGEEPVQSFEEMKKDLKKKIMSDGQRKEKVKDAAYAKIESKHMIVTDNSALSAFDTENPYSIPVDSLNKTLLTIDNERYLQKDFASYINNKRTKKPLDIYKDYKRNKLKEYITTNLDKENDELKETLITYKNGLVIFELMKNHVWSVPANQPEKVKVFYESNVAKYTEKGSAFEDVKGYVESDYQDMIQKKWLASLRAKNNIKINKRVVKKLRKASK